MKTYRMKIPAYAWWIAGALVILIEEHKTKGFRINYLFEDSDLLQINPNIKIG